MDELTREFLGEAEEMLRELEAALDALEGGGGEEAARRAYRAVHVIRGGAGFVGLGRTERLAAAGERLFGETHGAAAVAPGRELHAALARLLAAAREAGAEPAGDDGELLARLGPPEAP